MSIPEFRGDVLRLLSNLYRLLDSLTNAFQDVVIECSEVVSAQQAVKGTKDPVAVLGTRAFFRNLRAMRDHINQIGVDESEADRPRCG